MEPIPIVIDRDFARVMLVLCLPAFMIAIREFRRSRTRYLTLPNTPWMDAAMAFAISATIFSMIAMLIAIGLKEYGS